MGGLVFLPVFGGRDVARWAVQVGCAGGQQRGLQGPCLRAAKGGQQLEQALGSSPEPESRVLNLPDVCNLVGKHSRP